MRESDENGPLSGLTVIDLTQVVSGPTAAMMFAEFGAEVIKIEPPEGEAYRRIGRPIHGESGSTNLNFLRWSRGKRSVMIDLKQSDGKDLLWKLIDKADILIENMLPGKLAALGFDAATLRDRNPRLLYVTVSGFGHEDVLPSPYANRPTYAVTAEALAGLTNLATDREGNPVWLGFAMADVFAGVLAFSGTLLALRKRDQTGEGGRVDIGMYDGALFMNDQAIARYGTLQEEDLPGPRVTLQSPFGVYPTIDGHVAIAVMNDREWRSICSVMDREDLAEEEDLRSGLARSQAHDRVVGPAVAEWLKGLTKDQAAERLLEAGVPAAPLVRAGEIFASEQTAARQMLVPAIDSALGEVTVVGNPIKISGVSMPRNARIPALGEDTDEVLSAKLGLSHDDLIYLRASGVVG